MFQHEGRSPADSIKVSSVHIVHPAADGGVVSPGETQQCSINPAKTDVPFEDLCFSFTDHSLVGHSLVGESVVGQGFSVKEPVARATHQPRAWRTFESELLRSLQSEPATRQLERTIGVRGEGPAITFNSTSLRALIADNREKGLALLELYYPLYSASFPDPDERLPFETLLGLIQDPRFSINVDVLTSERGIIGGYQTHVADIDGEVYSLGDYLCVDNRMKGLGIAHMVYRTTIAERRETLGAIAHFGEVNDPRLMDAAQQAIDRKSGTDPEARLRFWSKQGRRMLDVPWIQPATAPGLAPVEYMMLTVHNLDEHEPLRITGETVQKVWDAYYLPLADVAPVHETRVEMEQLLAPYQGREVSLLPLTSPRSFMKKV